MRRVDIDAWIQARAEARAMHYCFAQSDLDEFKATLKEGAGEARRRPKEADQKTRE